MPCQVPQTSGKGSGEPVKIFVQKSNMFIYSFFQQTLLRTNIHKDKKTFCSVLRVSNDNIQAFERTLGRQRMQKSEWNIEGQLQQGDESGGS